MTPEKPEPGTRWRRFPNGGGTIYEVVEGEPKKPDHALVRMVSPVTKRSIGGEMEFAAILFGPTYKPVKEVAHGVG